MPSAGRCGRLTSHCATDNWQLDAELMSSWAHELFCETSAMKIEWIAVAIAHQNGGKWMIMRAFFSTFDVLYHSTLRISRVKAHTNKTNNASIGANATVTSLIALCFLNSEFEKPLKIRKKSTLQSLVAWTTRERRAPLFPSSSKNNLI